MSNFIGQDQQTYADLQLIAHAPALFNAIVAGLELGVFDHVSAHPESTLDEIIEGTGVPAHQLRILLLALCSLRLLNRHDGRYTTSRVADDQLSASRSDSWRHIFLSRHKTDYHGLAYASEALRSGTNAGLKVHSGDGETLYARLADDTEIQNALYASITAFTERTAPALIEHEELARARHLLDIGGGSGEMSRRFVTRYPGTEATVFDMASVVDLAGRGTPPDILGRIHLCAGDILAQPFPRVADTILFCHVLEVFAPEHIRSLLAKAYEALPSGGRALIYAFTAPDAEDGGVLAAQLSLYLNVLATGTGMAYPAADFASWLRLAGFGVRTFTGLPYEHSLIVGSKP